MNKYYLSTLHIMDLQSISDLRWYIRLSRASISSTSSIIDLHVDVRFSSLPFFVAESMMSGCSRAL